MGQIQGYIGYYCLQSWWEQLPETEKSIIQNTFQPMAGELGLTTSKIEYISRSVVGFLSDLADWFNKPSLLYLGLNIIEKGESLINQNTPVIEQNYLYAAMSSLYYKFNNINPSSTSLQQCIYACEKQIALAPQIATLLFSKFKQLPSHEGYEMLIDIFIGENDKLEVSRLVNKAKDEGWMGRWDRYLDPSNYED